MTENGTNGDRDSAAEGLFKRLPPALFGALAAPSREHNWRLLVQLYDRYFGPEADQPPDGYEHRAITAEVERYMMANADWKGDDGEPFSTEIGVRANLKLHQLRQWGWLREDKIGVRSHLVMPTAVVGFMGVLMSFAEQGPQIVGGQVQAIHNSLLAVIKNPSEQAGAFHQAASDSARLLSSLNATGVRVREVMDRLGAEAVTRDFVVGFFQHYVSELYIRDYQELRTQRNPLRLRHEILNLVYEISADTDARAALKGYYGRVYRLGADSDRERYLDRDVERLLRFNDIQKYLDRLDDAVQRGANQALNRISYSLRLQGKIELLIEQAIEATLAGETDHGVAALPLGMGPMFAAELLREPRVKKVAPERTATRKAPMTDRKRAAMRLWRARTMARNVGSKQIEAYLAPHLKPGGEVLSDVLPIELISDLCVFVALRREASGRRSSKGYRGKGTPAVRAVRGLEVLPIVGEWTDNEYLRTGRFVVKRAGEL